MPGMGRSLQTGNTLIVSSFHTALFHQLIAVLILGLLCAVGFNVFRTLQYRRLKANGKTSFPPALPDRLPEPMARRILRIGFGALWIFDGVLQIQSSMPLGLPTGVIQPAAGGSPGWVQHLVNSGVTIWSNHPIQAASATVWIQVGIGLWLLVAPRGRWSRFGGVASVGWGLLVWSFGEAFGGIFAPGATWLFGAPGAVLFYCAAGILIALPERAFATARLGRVVLALSGTFLIGMAVLQAWPGRGFWQGHGGTLTGMVRSMAQTPQPGFLSAWVSSFENVVAAHGWAVNLFAVIALATIGALQLSGRPRLVLAGLIAFVPLCLADWVLVEDLGFLGGLGTDPNSMLPMALLFVAGYVALVRVPVAANAADAVAVVPAAEETATGAAAWWERASLSYVIRTAAAVAALAIVLVGAAPMATAAVNDSADPILSEALNGSPNALELPAPQFTLTDQRGQTVSLASLRGHTVALTFLDPVCTSDCPLIAQEFRQTDVQLGSAARNVDFVAVVANPIYRSISFTKEFDSQESMNRLSNWYFLTGSVSQLQRVWNSYGVLVSTVGAGAMIAHSDLAFVIDGRGRERDALIDDPGPTQTFASSFTSLLLSRIDQVLNS
jgi:cytochrome oxidase Cu insertion factor (SCO1/SenC/PrrC family)